jgi:hypothetical protein
MWAWDGGGSTTVFFADAWEITVYYTEAAGGGGDTATPITQTASAKRGRGVLLKRRFR